MPESCRVGILPAVVSQCSHNHYHWLGERHCDVVSCGPRWTARAPITQCPLQPRGAHVTYDHGEPSKRGNGPFSDVYIGQRDSAGWWGTPLSIAVLVPITGEVGITYYPGICQVSPLHIRTGNRLPLPQSLFACGEGVPYFGVNLFVGRGITLYSVRVHGHIGYHHVGGHTTLGGR